MKTGGINGLQSGSTMNQPLSGQVLPDDKNTSLPKTASTINNTRTYTALESNQDINKKQISKELLSQVHFCRFVFKLLQRIENKIDGNMNEMLKKNMAGLIFDKLGNVQKLSVLNNLVTA